MESFNHHSAVKNDGWWVLKSEISSNDRDVEIPVIRNFDNMASILPSVLSSY